MNRYEMQAAGISLTTVYPPARPDQAHAVGWYLVGVMPGRYLNWPINGYMAVFSTLTEAQEYALRVATSPERAEWKDALEAWSHAGWVETLNEPPS